MLRSKHQILNPNSQLQNNRPDKFDFCRESFTNPPFSCKTNPICTNPEYSLTSVPTNGYVKSTKSSPQKANPNKPKQSQSDPRFSPVIAPQNQSKPKQTQTNPIYRCRPCLPRRSPPPSRVGGPATRPAITRRWGRALKLAGPRPAIAPPRLKNRANFVKKLLLPSRMTIIIFGLAVRINGCQSRI